MDKPEIKNCPCCGNKAQLKTKHPDYFGSGDWTKPTFKIKCTVCPITTGWLRDELKLIIGWNTRAQIGDKNDG